MGKKLGVIAYKIVLVITLIFCVFIFRGAITRAHKKIFVNMFSPVMRMAFPIFLALIICLFIILLYHCFDRFSHRKLVISSWIMFGIMAAVFGVMLYNYRSAPYTDAMNMQDTAMYFVLTGDRPMDPSAVHAEYFGAYGNNYFLTILFSWFFSLLMKMGVKDIYLPLLLLSAAGIMVSALLMYLIGVRIAGLRAGAKILVLCVLNPVYYILFLWVYTNVLSIPFMIAVIYFGICIYQEKRPGRQIALCIVEAVVSVVGYCIRPTAVIPLIALIICAFLWGIRKKENWKKILQCCMVCVIVGGLLFQSVSVLNDHYFSSVSGNTFPVTHWLMMGSHGTGRHNGSDVSFTASLGTKEQRIKGTIQRTLENYSSYSIPEFADFLHRKLVVSWSAGDHGDLLHKVSQDTKQTRLYSWINGNRRGLFREYCYAFRIATVFLIIVALLHLLRKRECNWYQFLFVLSFLGGIIFYCFWEIKSSYSAPFVYIMLLIGMQGGDVLADTLSAMEPGTWVRKHRPAASVILTLVLAVTLWICHTSYDAMIHTEVGHKNYTVYSDEGSSLERVGNEEGYASVTQEFYASKPFNRIKVNVLVDDEAKESGCSYHMALLDEDGYELYGTDIRAEDIEEKYLAFQVGEIVPEQREKYTLKLVKNEGSKGRICFRRRSNGYIDIYDGVLTIDDKEQAGDLWLWVYQKYTAPWCSVKTALLINGFLVAAALGLCLWFCSIRQKKVSSL